VVTGIVADTAGFEVLAGGERVGSRRRLGPDDAGFLAGLAARYGAAVRARSDDGDGVLAGLGGELSRWLDGDEGLLAGVLERAGSPVVFEVRAPRVPTGAGWALLRAPFELLTGPDGGFLAADPLLRFCVARRLGTPAAAPPLDGFRLGLGFMASSPRGVAELDFEAEEAAILAAAGEEHADLLVEDTGDPDQLARRLAEAGGVPVLHLSCHGLNNWVPRPGAVPVPALVMEDEAGGPRMVTAADLTGLLTTVPRLLFVSACLTATAGITGAGDDLPAGEGRKAGPAGDGGDGLVAHSLATALVSAGVPAVLGWDGSVADVAATVFAQRLYRALADRADVAVAVGDARRALLGSGDRWVRADWHLARLWLGPAGGGPAVAGTRKRSLTGATRGTRVFLDRKQQVPVTAPPMFVGRRPELQQAIRGLRAGGRAGVVLHGQGRLGKSSLAARVADRFPGHALAVVYGDYTALGILDAISDAVQGCAAARDLAAAGMALVRDRPAGIGEVLADLLAGPCAQDGPGGQRPLLLVIDDLEQVLSPTPGGPHHVIPGYAPVLAAVLRAFTTADTGSRLLVTTRFTFALGGAEGRLEHVQLRPLSPAGQAKLQRRQQALTPPERVTGRAGLASRAVAVSRGNPGLQDLTVLRLVYGEQVSTSRAEAAVAGMEAYLNRGDLPADAEVREFVEGLALDALLAEAGPAGAGLLRQATVFTLPVPEQVTGVLAAQAGATVGRLRGLGLLDPYPDRYDPARVAVAVSPLAAGRISPLTPAEQAAVAAACAGPLFTAWGGDTPPHPRADALDLQLTRLALLAGDPGITAACAAAAVSALRAGHAGDAARLGQDAINLLDQHSHLVPLVLLRVAADAAFTSGDGPGGERLLDRAVQQAGAGDQPGPGAVDRARVITEQGRRLITRGDLDQAGQLLGEARQLFTAAGSELEAAVVMGTLADIAYRRGDYDEALRIRREVQLPVYERLGDTRSAAVTWGRIADITYQRGDYDEALRIRREVQLPVYERLGDTRSAAITWGQIADIAHQRGDYEEAAGLQHRRLAVHQELGDLDGIAAATWDLAQIDLARQDYEAAFPRLAEAFQILTRLQRPDGIAAAGWPLGQLLMAAGQDSQASQVLHAALEAAARIGWTSMTEQITTLLNPQPPP
jgi:tetratricopeptide (TPR) repeat protein